MQKIAGFSLIAGLLMASCSNDFDLTTQWEDIPIVYGLLSPIDTAHYIRIEKAYLDPHTSALELAQIADSLYYDNVDASLIHIKSGDIFTLQEVDGTEEGYAREDGIFATMPNILYKLKANVVNLVPGDRYRLVINRGEGLPLVTAETQIVGRPTVTRPDPGQILRIDYINFVRVSWANTSAGFYDALVILHYREYPLSDPSQKTDKELTWKFAKNLGANEFQFQGERFYEFVGSELDEDPNIGRDFVSLEFEVLAGGAELAEFLRITQANTGITSVGEIPQYTNISEGRGIFSSVNEHSATNITLHPVSLDSLQDGIHTRDLNF